MGSKRVGGGLAGLNVAYAQAQDPMFWEHYSRDMAGVVVRKSSSSPKDTASGGSGGGSGGGGLSNMSGVLLGGREKESLDGGRLVGKDIDYAAIQHRVRRSTTLRHRLRENLHDVGAWQRDMWEKYQRKLEARDMETSAVGW